MFFVYFCIFFLLPLLCIVVYMRKYIYENIRFFPKIQAGALKTSYCIWKLHADSSCANAMSIHRPPAFLKMAPRIKKMLKIIPASTPKWFLCKIGKSDNREIGKLGNWEIGELGNWEIGKLGNWEIWKLGNREIGELGNWEIGKSLILFPSLRIQRKYA